MLGTEELKEVKDSSYDEDFDEFFEGSQTVEKIEVKNDEVKPDVIKEVKPEETNSNHGDFESVTKALLDTKASLTKTQQERAELKKELEQIKSKAESNTELGLGEAQKDLDSLAETFPELKNVFGSLQAKINSLTERLEKREQLTAKEKQDEYNKLYFIPAIEKHHEDFKSVVVKDEFNQWLNIQTPATKFAFNESEDPSDVAEVVSRYKKTLHLKDAEELKQKITKEKESKFDLMKSTGSGGSVPGKASNKDDYDSSFDEFFKSP